MNFCELSLPHGSEDNNRVFLFERSKLKTQVKGEAEIGSPVPDGAKIRNK
jgi:hypothetical protein